MRSISGPLSFFFFVFPFRDLFSESFFFCSLFFLSRTTSRRALGLALALHIYIFIYFRTCLYAIPARDAETGGQRRAGKSDWKRKVWARPKVPSYAV